MDSALISPRVLSLGVARGGAIIRPIVEIVYNETRIFIDDQNFILSQYGEIAENCDHAKTILKLLSSQSNLFEKVVADIGGDALKNEISILKAVFEDRYLITDDASSYAAHANEVSKFGIFVVGAAKFNNLYRKKQVISNDELAGQILNALKNMVQRKSAQKIENLHNDILADSLRAHGSHCNYSVADQARSGESSEGGVGSLDLFIFKDSQTPFAIIECLRANSFGPKEKNVSSHFNKLLENYDKIGLSRNYLLIYCGSSDFKAAYESYIDLIDEMNSSEEFTTKYKIKKSQSRATGVANIKLLITTHEREGSLVEVFHYFADFSTSKKALASTTRKLTRAKNKTVSAP